jgi:hypothetical protein
LHKDAEEVDYTPKFSVGQEPSFLTNLKNDYNEIKKRFIVQPIMFEDLKGNEETGPKDVSESGVFMNLGDGNVL